MMPRRQTDQALMAAILCGQPGSNRQSGHDEKLRHRLETIGRPQPAGRENRRQVSGVQVPLALRQATPRATLSAVPAVTVWLYCRQFCEPT